MSQEKFWVLLSKKLSGEASDTELKELEKLILEHPEWQYAVQNLGDLWKHQPVKDDLQAQDAYMLHLHRMTEMNIPFGDSPVEMPANVERKSTKKLYWAAAAVFILSIGLWSAGFLFKNKGNKNQAVAQVNEISTRKGSKSKIQLPDGSVVWLNAGSKLTYDKDFGKDLREVTLIGEGFFDVQKMKDKPFIVHTSAIHIKVLGTVFNVKAYPEDKKTETSLIHGSIEVTMKNRPNDKIILSPSEKLIVDNNIIRDKAVSNRQQLPEPDVKIDMLVSINKLKYGILDSAVAETQWIDNKLVFDDESFEELALKMERWYDVEIEISNPKLLAKRMTGNFEKETIAQAMEALKVMIPFSFEQTGNKIIIN